jgi:sigma-B regulation protein RsbU (phosphoserine phosphatase)
MVLGLFPEAPYETGSIKLQPDEHLVLFTDGVIEALNAEGEEFGVDRLIALLQTSASASASDILSRMQEAVLSFSEKTPQHDDITMMVVGFRESRGHFNAAE